MLAHMGADAETRPFLIIVRNSWSSSAMGKEVGLVEAARLVSELEWE